MLPDRVSNPGPLTYESDALPIALRGPARELDAPRLFVCKIKSKICVKSIYRCSKCGLYGAKRLCSDTLKSRVLTLSFANKYIHATLGVQLKMKNIKLWASETG